MDPIKGLSYDELNQLLNKLGEEDSKMLEQFKFFEENKNKRTYTIDCLQTMVEKIGCPTSNGETLQTEYPLDALLYYVAPYSEMTQVLFSDLFLAEEKFLELS